MDLAFILNAGKKAAQDAAGNKDAGGDLSGAVSTPAVKSESVDSQVPSQALDSPAPKKAKAHDENVAARDWEAGGAESDTEIDLDEVLHDMRRAGKLGMKSPSNDKPAFVDRGELTKRLEEERANLNALLKQGIQDEAERHDAAMRAEQKMITLASGEVVPDYYVALREPADGPVAAPKTEPFPSSEVQLGRAAQEWAERFRARGAHIRATAPARVSTAELDKLQYFLVKNRLNRAAPTVRQRRLAPRPFTEERINHGHNGPAFNRAYRFDTAATNIACFPHLEYTLCETSPYCARINPLDHGPESYLVGPNADIFTTFGPYETGRANVCLRGGGKWYFEVEVLQPDVRLGIGRREAGGQAPVGYNAYSYGLQSKTGDKVHCSFREKFMEPFGAGDVIGFEVYLPIDPLVKDPVRLRQPFLHQDQVWMESHNYLRTDAMNEFRMPKNFRPLRPEEGIPGSYCRVYRNGEPAGTLAEPLMDFRPPNAEFDYWLRVPSRDDGMLGYFPMVSVYRGGAARFVPGPDFRFPPPSGARGLYARYGEQIADDVLADMLSELEYEEVDAVLPDSARRAELGKGRDRKDNGSRYT